VVPLREVAPRRRHRGVHAGEAAASAPVGRLRPSSGFHQPGFHLPERDALCKLLGYLGVDEQAHHHFFLEAVRLFLRHDRAGTLRQLRRVLHNFSMPAIYELADGPRRVAAIKALGVFNDELYFREVYQPVLASLRVGRPELRRAA